VGSTGSAQAIELRAEQSGAPETDSALVQALARGDQEAFRAIYDRHIDSVYSHCLRLTGSAASAEDLAAVVFLESWRRRKDFRVVEGSAAPWLHGIAYNCARNSWRASRRYSSALKRLSDSRVVPDHSTTVIERIAAQETIRRLLPAIHALPNQEREAIELCIAADMTYQEAASLLAVPIGTVKSRLSRALSKLRASAGVEVNGEDL
jgi:RNA polymerase sigma factor (sigma-70 family)